MKELFLIVKAVEAIYKEIELQEAQFKQQSGLYCKAGCSKCCQYKNIKASVLEFIPFAWHTTLNNNQNQIMDKINLNSNTCVLYSPLSVDNVQSGCNHYGNRGFICRVFGFSAVSKANKQLALYTCKEIKNNDVNFNQAETMINNGLSVPKINELQIKFNAIDYGMAFDFNPINVSIKKALIKVDQYFNYKPKHKKIQRSA